MSITGTSESGERKGGLECGGKRSAPPLAKENTTVADIKAPSPLRSAGAVQNASGLREQNKQREPQNVRRARGPMIGGKAETDGSKRHGLIEPKNQIEPDNVRPARGDARPTSAGHAKRPMNSQKSN